MPFIRSSNSYSELAYKILSKNKKPMHYKDITDEIIKIKKTKGKTPAQTLRVAISKDKRFMKIGRGMYKLR